MATPLPPILVHRPTMRIIDGMHRLHAARLRGRTTIEAHFFDGSEHMAFLLAVRENIAHGLPLTAADRMAAALRILEAHPDWSDRAVAMAAGSSTRRVAALRRRSTETASQSNTRVGRDGRLRPVDGAAGRLRAGEIVRERPDTPLREVAREAGISVATARDVRERLKQGQDLLPPRQRATRAPRTTPLSAASREAALGQWPVLRQKLRQDPAVRYAQSGLTFLRWLDTRVVYGEEWREFLASVPAHWADEIAALAKGCAENWKEVARELERRRSRSA
ncbi:ParB N-terminal domain-containing protein [Spirillospora sp. NBC_01491]|uniref:ParB N-terminal domain-containing protein n=1 Tax=Spirillospora sp. NBC_01491 TaxID=2976007 RepID=UPI002E37504A|nr:ParB N-terminal domain-containing protein [Spirillospora sp. NBC_01491]